MRPGRTLTLTMLAASALVIATAGIVTARALPPGGTFIDDDGNVHESNIEAIAAAGITTGCNPPANDRYCPSSALTRGQMAAFVRRALDLPSAGTDYFTDDNDSIFEADINAIARAGVTRGCNPPANDRFCPDGRITRGQLAAFLRRAFSYPSASTDYFTDDNGSIYEADINAIAQAGVTKGCNPPANNRYCPTNLVLRDQMASFFSRALGLAPIETEPRCPTFPTDNIWNRRVNDLPVDANSSRYIATMGANATLHAGFGSGVWPPASNSPIGIPYVNVSSSQPDVEIIYTAYGNVSDPGPFPIPRDAPIEGGPDASGDRHVVVVDRDACMLYELYRAFPNGDGSWSASSGASYNLRSNALRPDGWTSADAAGLPIYPGLITYDEVKSGIITHAIRFTTRETRNVHVWPARHHDSNRTSSDYPPMGQRFRLKAGYDISSFSPDVQVILKAFKDYGLILADNGGAWAIFGAPDPRWDNSVLRELDDVPGSAFEAVNVSSLIIDPDSGRARG